MLKKNEHAVLRKNPNELKFDKFPFYIGVVDSPENKGFPLKLPFVIEFDGNSGAIIQRYSKENDAVIEEVYKKGSSLSTNLGQGSFGVRRADEVLKYLVDVSPKPLSENSFLK